MDLKSGHDWMDDELMMDWLIDGWFTCLLTCSLSFPEKFREISGKFPAFYFSGKFTTLPTSEILYGMLTC